MMRPCRRPRLNIMRTPSTCREKKRLEEVEHWLSVPLAMLTHSQSQPALTQTDSGIPSPSARLRKGCGHNRPTDEQHVAHSARMRRLSSAQVPHRARIQIALRQAGGRVGLFDVARTQSGVPQPSMAMQHFCVDSSSVGALGVS